MLPITTIVCESSLGLPGVVLLLAHHLQLHSRVGGQAVLERRERLGRRQPREHRLPAVPAAVERRQHAGVAPDLRVGHGAARVEDADDGPDVLPELELRADGKPAELAGSGAADDDLVPARLEWPARDHLEVADPKGGRLDAAQRGVRRRSGARLHEIDADEQLGRREGPDAGRAGDLRRVLHDDDVLVQQDARHLGVGPRAHDDRGIRRSGARHRRPDALGDRQDGHEDGDNARHADHGHPGRRQPASERPQVERGDDRRLEQTGEDPHGGHTLRSASTMRRRIARRAGKMPETTPSPTTSARPATNDAFGT